jgi:hypothetical protein
MPGLWGGAQHLMTKADAAARPPPPPMRTTVSHEIEEMVEQVVGNGVLIDAKNAHNATHNVYARGLQIEALP